MDTYIFTMNIAERTTLSLYFFFTPVSTLNVLHGCYRIYRYGKKRKTSDALVDKTILEKWIYLSEKYV